MSIDLIYFKYCSDIIAALILEEKFWKSKNKEC